MISFVWKGLKFVADVVVTAGESVGLYCRPDDATESTDDEVVFESLYCEGRDAMFLLDSDFLSEIEEAAIEALRAMPKEVCIDPDVDLYCF